MIKRLKEEGKTQKEIDEVLGWSRDKVKNHSRLLENVGTEVLNFCKAHQERRVPSSATNVPTFNFTEGWFRDSGIYDLPVIEDEHGNVIRNRQMELVKWFISVGIRASISLNGLGLYEVRGEAEHLGEGDSRNQIPAC